jgi:hypothetical protein
MSEKIYFEGKTTLGNYRADLALCALFGITIIGLLYAIPKALGIVLKVYTTTFKITSERIQVETGVLSRTLNSLELWRINDIMFRQTLIQRMFKECGILLVSQDKTHPFLGIDGLPEKTGRQIFESLQADIAKARKDGRVVSLAS